MTTQVVMNNSLKAILVELGIPPELLQKEARLYQDLKLDSTEIVEISLGLKRKLGISLKLESRQDLTLAQASVMIEAEMLVKTTVDNLR